MGYPNAYRQGSQGYQGPGRGFQPPRPHSVPGNKLPGGWTPPKPANDNRALLGQLYRGAGIMRKMLPALRAAELAVDLYDWMNYTETKWQFPQPWYLYFRCPRPIGYTGGDTWARQVMNSCLTGQASGAPNGSTPSTILASVPKANFMSKFYLGFFTSLNVWRAATAEVWKRPIVYETAPQTYPTYRPGTAPVPNAPPFVRPLPQPLPRVVPPLQPMPEPVPVPYEEIPYRPAPEFPNDPDRGYEPWSPSKPRPRPRPRPAPFPSPRPRPAPEPVLVPPSTGPGTSPQPNPGTVPKVHFVPNASPFPRVRPPKGEKERKIMSGSPGYGAMLDWAKRYEDLLDARDFVKAVHDALPKKYQTKSKLPQDQLLAVYRHINELDAAQAIKNIAREIVEDRLGGALDKLRGKAARGVGVTKQQIRTWNGL